MSALESLGHPSPGPLSGAAPDAAPAVAPAGAPAGAPGPLLLDDEPIRLVGEEFDRLLVWAVAQGASDITLQDDEPVWLEIHGRNHPVTRRVMSNAELIEIVNGIYGANGATQIFSGRDIDVSYEVYIDRLRRLRFRVNGAAIQAKSGTGIQITLRALPDEPARLVDLGVESEIVAACEPAQGLVLITGPTGSGKTTLLGAIIRHKIERADAHRKVLTFEAPIELRYDKVKGPDSYVAQAEVPRHEHSFAAGLRSALRRKPADILVGECRDAETMGTSCEAALTGHTVYSTLHSNGVAETVRRMISVFPAMERQGRAIDLAESLRLVVTQVLLPTVDGRRVAAREFLVFDADVRDALLSTEVDRWPQVTRSLIRERGQGMGMAVRRIFDDGRGPISAETCERFLRVQRRRELSQETVTGGPDGVA